MLPYCWTLREFLGGKAKGMSCCPQGTASTLGSQGGIPGAGPWEELPTPGYRQDGSEITSRPNQKPLLLWQDALENVLDFFNPASFYSGICEVVPSHPGVFNPWF